jgi:hypothetical protein
MRWSYSSLKSFERCPRLYKYQHLDRLPRPPDSSPALERGSRIHGLIEDYLLGRVEVLDPMFSRFAEFIDEIKKSKVVEIEGKWAVTKDWQPTDWDAPDAWWRGRLDAYVRKGKTVARVIDWKTGGMYGDNVDQMHLYAAVAFSRDPGLTRASTELVYLDHHEASIKSIPKTMGKHIKDEFGARVMKIERAKAFPTRPGRHCNWCPYHKSKGGPCAGT